jgi:hypothetical protein
VDGEWFSLGTLVSYLNEIHHLDITEILLKVALSTIKPTNCNCNYNIFKESMKFEIIVYY